jgi:hypothetical protein
VQLAAAGELNARRGGFRQPPTSIILVSADQEFNAAATAEGLAVEDPNFYP